MDDGPLDDTLEAGGRLRVFVIAGHEVGKFVIDIIGNGLAQVFKVDVTSAHDRRRVRVINQREKQMFERGIFMMPLVGEGQCLMQRLFKTRRKCGHVGFLTSFP
ncbi:hypothetical protein D3C80_1066640 [compost metagenome]